MSKFGIKLAAGALFALQATRGELIALSQEPEGDNQDLLLGQLLDDAKDAIKDEFAEITMAAAGARGK